eukprot:6286376-Amphidinium_carterae.1
MPCGDGPYKEKSNSSFSLLRCCWQERRLRSADVSQGQQLLQSFFWSPPVPSSPFKYEGQVGEWHCEV